MDAVQSLKLCRTYGTNPRTTVLAIVLKVIPGEAQLILRDTSLGLKKRLKLCFYLFLRAKEKRERIVRAILLMRMH